MIFRRIALCGICLLTVVVSASCATSKVVGDNIHRVVNGQPVDDSGLHDAVASDAKVLEANLQQLRKKFAEAVAKLRANVQQHWGQNDAKIADKTVYVKYTQGYKTRVVTDFDHGTLTIETVEQTDAPGNLRRAIIAALLTSNDPAAVDLFSDKDVTLEPQRRPYLYDLVRDNQGKPVHTRVQAEAFASYLVAQKMQTRPVAGDQGANTAHFVKLVMVRNFEAKGAERYRTAVLKYSDLYHVSPSLVFAIIRTESNFNPFAVSGAPAYGLMQLVPTSGGRAAVQRVQGVDETPTPDQLLDPEHNIELGTAYLSVLSNNEFQAVQNPDSRDYCVIAAYNTGPHNVTKTFAKDKAQAFGTINTLDPPILFDRLRTSLPSDETRQYVVRVTGYRSQFVALSGPALPTKE